MYNIRLLPLPPQSRIFGKLLIARDRYKEIERDKEIGTQTLQGSVGICGTRHAYLLGGWGRTRIKYKPNQTHPHDRDDELSQSVSCCQRHTYIMIALAAESSGLPGPKCAVV